MGPLELFYRAAERAFKKANIKNKGDFYGIKVKDEPDGVVVYFVHGVSPPNETPWKEGTKEYVSISRFR